MYWDDKYGTHSVSSEVSLVTLDFFKYLKFFQKVQFFIHQAWRLSHAYLHL